MNKTNDHLKNTLDARAEKYGTVESNAITTEGMMDILRASKSFKETSNTHKMCAYMICHKLARMFNGDPYYADNAHDIAGYAQLLETHIKTVTAKPWQNKKK